MLGEAIIAETDKNAVAQQLAKINEQLAMKNQRSKTVWKVIVVILCIIVIFYILAIVVFSVIAPKVITYNHSENVIEIE